jgi:Ser-tRNA(Ala) deacylase AlaX
MTDLLYQKDSYLKVFDAEVVEKDANSSGFVLNRTAFYPGGGGDSPMTPSG